MSPIVKVDIGTSFIISIYLKLFSREANFQRKKFEWSNSISEWVSDHRNQMVHSTVVSSPISRHVTSSREFNEDPFEPPMDDPMDDPFMPDRLRVKHFLIF